MMAHYEEFKAWFLTTAGEQLEKELNSFRNNPSKEAASPIMARLHTFDVPPKYKNQVISLENNLNLKLEVLKQTTNMIDKLRRASNRNEEGSPKRAAIEHRMIILDKIQDVFISSHQEMLSKMLKPSRFFVQGKAVKKAAQIKHRWNAADVDHIARAHISGTKPHQ
jgi:hypothetical protein